MSYLLLLLFFCFLSIFSQLPAFAESSPDNSQYIKKEQQNDGLELETLSQLALLNSPVSHTAADDFKKELEDQQARIQESKKEFEEQRARIQEARETNQTIRNVILGFILMLLGLLLAGVVFLVIKRGPLAALQLLGDNRRLIGAIADEIGKNGSTKFLNTYIQRNYSFAFDTNVLMNCPELLELLAKKGGRILISRVVQSELDGLKKNQDTKGEMSRRAFHAIVSAQEKFGPHIHLLPFISDHFQGFMGEHGLDIGMKDDQIIATYLKEQMKGQKLVFLTNDHGAKMTAMSVGLEVYDPLKK
jgi:hypothetical protein